jgi:adenylate kinase family enzyme
MNKIYFIIGASGAGKTTAVKHIQKRSPQDFQFCFFDSVGVPPVEDMIKMFGSQEGWQRAGTDHWIKIIKENYLDTRPAILDGQTRGSFIEEACRENGIASYEVILFDCSDEERRARLKRRNQSELANEQMMNWAKYLRNEAKQKGYKIIDNTHFTEEESALTLNAVLKGR